MDSRQSSFARSVFINCPFDTEYKPLLQALLFTILDCGFEARIASEDADSGQARIDKILRLVEECRFSIHDISRMEPLAKAELPRFNMAFELGLDLGCRKFGRERLRGKQCLVLEKERYRYQRVLSDLSGNDIRAHGGDPQRLVLEVRSWLRVATRMRLLSGTDIWHRFNKFGDYLEAALGELRFSRAEIARLEVVEFLELARGWIERRRSSP